MPRELNLARGKASFGGYIASEEYICHRCHTKFFWPGCQQFCASFYAANLPTQDGAGNSEKLAPFFSIELNRCGAVLSANEFDVDRVPSRRDRILKTRFGIVFVLFWYQ